MAHSQPAMISKSFILLLEDRNKILTKAAWESLALELGLTKNAPFWDAQGGFHGLWARRPLPIADTAGLLHDECSGFTPTYMNALPKGLCVPSR